MLWNHNSAARASHTLIGVFVFTVASPCLALAQSAVGGTEIKTRPAAVIERVAGERSETVQLSFFATRDLSNNAGISWKIFVTDTRGGALELNQEDCPTVFRAIGNLERLSIPRVEIGPDDILHGQPPVPPNLGTLHQSYRATLSAFSDEDAPVEITLSHLGAGPVRDWWDSARVDDCLTR